VCRVLLARPPATQNVHMGSSCSGKKRHSAARKRRFDKRAPPPKRPRRSLPSPSPFPSMHRIARWQWSHSHTFQQRTIPFLTSPFRPLSAMRREPATDRGVATGSWHHLMAPVGTERNGAARAHAQESGRNRAEPVSASPMMPIPAFGSVRPIRFCAYAAVAIQVRARLPFLLEGKGQKLPRHG
jgi:hypothetical protein